MSDAEPTQPSMRPSIAAIAATILAVAATPPASEEDYRDADAAVSGGPRQPLDAERTLRAQMVVYRWNPYASGPDIVKVLRRLRARPLSVEAHDDVGQQAIGTVMPSTITLDGHLVLGVVEFVFQPHHRVQRTFGIPDSKYCLRDLAVEDIACECHEANRLYCQEHGDESQVAWELAPEWQRASAIAGVQAVAADWRITPEQLHAGWMAIKVADGWIFGETKNAEFKTHPCMVPYGELPAVQRGKDDLFRSTVLKRLHRLRLPEAPVAPDAACVTRADGECIAEGPCMHTPPEDIKPASQEG